ncbi:type 1 glutamine amidotransferase domain-containing protein [uncultured Jatrophihabitans sp.]|uniref:type 1 glutamine amidotransferase domain-containing protein n=1 Tax=uncultured Jatrophihabitans sp. TaxID=1610747 RepID=UPI0035CA75D6
MRRVLIVMSAADTWTRTDGSRYPTGYWAEEVAAPYERFVAAGFDVDFASPGGVLQPLDQHSADPQVAGPECGRWVEHAENALRKHGPLLALEDVELGTYDAVVLPGGHGPVVDLHQDANLGRVLVDADTRGAVIGAVCHGPAGLLSAVEPDGSWRFAGRRMAAFTDEEEQLFGTAELAPWLLASRLRQRGAMLTDGAAYQAHIERDGNLFTGQNPASSGPMAEAIVAALS